MLEGAFRDLDIAEKAIENMADADNMPDLLEHWQNFLIRIERVWEQVERRFRPTAGFQQWVKPYAVLRRKDPLIRFLRYARDAETHAVSPTIDKPIKLLFREKYGRAFGITSISYRLQNGTLRINVDTPERDLLFDYNVDIVPTDPHLQRFKNRSVWYNAPTSHLGNRLKPLHPIVAARLGLSFYRAFIQEAIDRFGSPTYN